MPMPMPKHPARDAQMRIRLAQEAARVMIDDGIRDFQTAKRKAADHLGVSNTRNLPRNQEIEEARQAYQRLFLGERQQHRQQQLQHAAVKAMTLLQEFDPHLTGQVLDGSAAPNAAVELHLFADTPEAVARFLHNSGIPYDERHTRLRYDHDTNLELPMYAFVAGDLPIELTVFPREGRRQAPLSRVDGQPVRRARLPEVEALAALDDVMGD